MTDSAAADAENDADGTIGGDRVQRTGEDGAGSSAGDRHTPSAAGRHARTHLPWQALFFPALLFVCITPLATTGPWWLVAYALPAAALLVVVTGGTTATDEHLIARWWRGVSRITWENLDRLEFPSGRWAVAVTHSGKRMLLPGVRPVDLPRIVSAAGGRLFLRRPVEPADAATQRSSEPTSEQAASATTGRSNHAATNPAP